MSDFFFDVLMPFIGGLIILLFAALLLWGAAEVFYSRAAFEATAACQQTRGVAKRKILSTAVACVPENARQDTSTVNLNVKK